MRSARPISPCSGTIDLAAGVYTDRAGGEPHARFARDIASGRNGALTWDELQPG